MKEWDREYVLPYWKWLIVRMYRFLRNKENLQDIFETFLIALEGMLIAALIYILAVLSAI